MSTPVVTALRARGPGRVAVELDGAPWRVVPLEAVYAAGLAVGGQLDRTRHERSGASCGGSRRRRGRAAGAARARPHGCVARAAARRRAAPRPSVRRETVEAAQRAGLVDDRRFALERARSCSRPAAPATS